MQNLNRDDRREMRRQMVNSLVLLLVVLGLAAVCAEIGRASCRERV